MVFVQDMVAEEYHLDVLGINLQGGRKTSKKKNCVSLPQAKEDEKIKILAEYQGPGAGTSRYQTDQIRPN